MPARLTTEDFIAKAREVHGDRYDYSKVDYVNGVTKVTVICDQHGEFTVQPRIHLAGSNCKKCSHDSRRKTTDQFKAEAKAKHGKRYDYRKTVYKGILAEVIVTCPKHGDFKQSAASHLAGSGCSECYRLAATSTTEEFIAKAKKVHGKKYHYSKVDYVKAIEKVIITCPKHGDFKQTPNVHLCGKGCRECAIASRSKAQTKTTPQFIADAKAIHGDRYIYKNTVYTGAHDKLTIRCKKHGLFNQSATSHLSGAGCWKCDDESNSKTTEEFISEARAVHGDRYGYEKVDYKLLELKVKIICRDCGVFRQTGHSHLKGHGCPVCANRGNSKTFVYLVKLNVEDESFLKIGITSYSVRQRFKHLKYSTPSLTYRKIDTILFDHPNDAQELEQELHDVLEEYQFIPSTKFGGYTECFHLDYRKEIVAAFRAAKQKYEG